ncbi:MAG: hypothetical protein AAF204_00795, partial [Pseudomonadota bacterium]
KASSQTTSAHLSGFEPNTIVSYKILSKSGTPLFANARTDERGQLKIAVPPGFAKDSDEIVFDFAIEEAQQSLALIVEINRKTGDVSVNGQGAESYSDIEISTSGKSFKTRTDWAGLFNETGIQASIEDEEPIPVEVAFYSHNVASDAQNRSSPAMVKVQVIPSILLGGSLSFFIETFYVDPLKRMTRQLSTIAMYPLPMIGKFFDAKDQLEAQRTHQMLKAEAVKDYHPSEQICRIGSYMRSLPNAETKATSNHLILNDALSQRYTNKSGMSTVLGRETDIVSRIEQFKNTYCDPSDVGTKISAFCAHAGGTGAQDPARVNKDIDYANNVELPLTMDIDFSDNVLTNDEEDVLSLARNLYWTDAFQDVSERDLLTNYKYHIQARQLMALANLSHNSFAKLVAMKARAPDAAPGVQPGWAHMKTMMRELGMADADIEDVVGTNPSYFAQMDILTKKLYQNPNFYTNLYDKPVNVERINTSLEAIKLMQMRDHYEASLRREMLISGIIGNELVSDAEKIQGRLLAD